ncbi:MAG: NapC/NirT family cytochrome c [Candidatus Latescibacterota bacterium]|nr:MAG: NapC/NirT family cytochrome c [Candidatus Latescibacterota bacterium]
MRALRFPRLVYNKISIAGGFVAVITALTMVFFLFVQAGKGETNPYVGILIYMVLPPGLLVGLILVPVGMFRQWKFLKKHGADVLPPWPQIDFNKKTHRNVFIVFLVGGLIYACMSAVGAYQAYHHTESVEFCGETCHKVMKPENTAYRNSAHARVACTACHVGEGANWYAKSKLAGAYQVYATTFNKYPKPIPTPIKNLRPAQETCEQCHWPRKFFGAQQRQFNHYIYDEDNTAWPINMLIKTGGGDPKTGQTAGIHWHMNIGVKVEYIARDERRQDIPWVRVTDNLTGRITVYQHQDDPLTDEELQNGTRRVMDCMDCHNRPSHNFHPPDFVVDRAILTGQIAQDLPDIKRVAVWAMDGDYDSEETAVRSIATKIVDHYKHNYADVFRTRRVDIQQAVVATQQQFTQNIFPEMEVRWLDYPDNIGHFIYPGCMRCHEGKHVSEEGWTLTRECNTCHSILSQGSGERYQVASTPEGLEFVHPEDIGEEWREIGCHECHTGTQP